VESIQKEFGEPESEAFGGILDDADYILRISVGGVANVIACKQSTKDKLFTASTSQLKMH